MVAFGPCALEVEDCAAVFGIDGNSQDNGLELESISTDMTAESRAVAYCSIIHPINSLQRLAVPFLIRIFEEGPHRLIVYLSNSKQDDGDGIPLLRWSKCRACNTEQLGDDIP